MCVCVCVCVCVRAHVCVCTTEIRLHCRTCEWLAPFPRLLAHSLFKEGNVPAL